MKTISPGIKNLFKVRYNGNGFHVDGVAQDFIHEEEAIAWAVNYSRKHRGAANYKGGVFEVWKAEEGSDTLIADFPV